MAYSNAIFYVDLYNGNDTARTVLTECIASNPFGVTARITKVGHGLQTGDIVLLANFNSWLSQKWRITKVNDDAFDLDDAVWENTTDYNGTVYPQGGSRWDDAWKTIAYGATYARLQAGDEIRICKTPDPVNIGNATWTNMSKEIILETAQTLTIDNCETAWTAANSATVLRQAVSTDAKQGDYCMQVTAPSSPTTNRKYAFYPTGTLDLSAFQKLSFYSKNDVSLVDGNWKICLCSDLLGDVVVDTFEIPSSIANSRWKPLTIERTGGGNLGSAIKSIALYSGTVAPTASKYVRLDNFIACTTNGLNLQSLISKNGQAQGGSEGYYAIQSIDGTKILLDGNSYTKSSNGKGYVGESETVTTYIRESYKTAEPAYSSNYSSQIYKSGTIDNPVSYLFGYDPLTNTINGETFLDGLSGWGYGLVFVNISYVSINCLNLLRYYAGYYISTTSNVSILRANSLNNNYQNAIILSGCTQINIGTIENICMNGSTSIVFQNNCSCNTIDVINNMNSNEASGISISNSGNNTINLINSATNNQSHGIHFSSSCDNTIRSALNVNNNVLFAVNFFESNNNLVGNLSGTGNGSGTFSNNMGTNYLRNATMNDSNRVVGMFLYSRAELWSFMENGIAGNNWGYFGGAMVNWQTAVKRSEDQGAWKSLITVSQKDVNNKLRLKIAEVACLANTQTIISAWVKKDHATNVACRLITDADPLLGTTEQTHTKANNTVWEQLSVTFMPTIDCVVPVYLESWYVAAVSSTYVGSITVS